MNGFFTNKCEKCGKEFETPYPYVKKCPECNPKQKREPHEVTFGHWTPSDYKNPIYD